MHLRAQLTIVHRWVGLAIAFFIAMSGFTGALLAYNTELERVFAPRLFASPRPGADRLNLAELAVRAATIAPERKVASVLYTTDDQAQVHFQPLTGHVGHDDFETQYFIDPWTGAELGHRLRGDLSEGWVNVMPFVYRLHWTLALGSGGAWVMGVAALLWTIDSVNGAYLTLPPGWTNIRRRWSKAWRFKYPASPFRILYDLHRASGLWFWAILFVFAWSSVMFNLRPIYEAVTATLFDYRSPREFYASLPRRRNDQPKLDWRAALITGDQLMRAEAAKFGLLVREPLGLGYAPNLGLYRYEARSSADVFEREPKGGSTTVFFDGDDGTLRAFERPTGVSLGNTIESWLYALHMSRVFGRPYQLFVFAVGLISALVSISGVLIWLKKRRGRKKIANRAERNRRLSDYPLKR